MVPETLTPERKRMLIEFMVVYTPFTESERIEYMNLIQTPPYEKLYPMIKSIYDEALEKGMEKGQRRAIEKILQVRFGMLSETTRQRLADYPAEKLDTLLEAALAGKSLKDLGLED